MKLFVLDMKDDEGCAMDLALRAQEVGHEVRYWLPKAHPVGKGLVDKPRDWEPSMDWADLIVLTGNCDYPPGFEEYFTKAYPIFGTCPQAAELELDRGKGQDILDEYGIDTLPYTVCTSAKEAIDFLIKEGRPYAMKPWGGEADKAMTCVPGSVEEGIWTLQCWERKGMFKGQLMMQKMVKGVEIGISAFFGPGGWSAQIEESFEHKKFMNDDLGGNTGEMGTVIRHVKKSKLFDMLLEPLTDYLHLCRFVGDCSVNCIVDAYGTPWPLEFTCRLGWPDFCIRQELVKGDPLQWMVDLLYGRDTFDVSPQIAVGVVMAHGDFPRENEDPKEFTGFPISGVTTKNFRHLHFQQVQDGVTPVVIGGKVKEIGAMVTAGTYPLVVTGSGATVEAARRSAYGTAWEIKWPSNVMFRTDIGKRLEADLPKLHKFGFAEGMKYG